MSTGFADELMNGLVDGSLDDLGEPLQPWIVNQLQLFDEIDPGRKETAQKERQKKDAQASSTRDPTYAPGWGFQCYFRCPNVHICGHKGVLLRVQKRINSAIQ